MNVYILLLLISNKKYIYNIFLIAKYKLLRRADAKLNYDDGK